jgi:cobalamin biosynthesis Co2+ chelatase CbiK
MTYPESRFRKIRFPVDWLDYDCISVFIEYVPEIVDYNKVRVQKNVLRFMLKYCDYNTHSLHYTCINHFLRVKNYSITEVVKFVGHVNVNMLVRYTQNKNVEEIHYLDI